MATVVLSKFEQADITLGVASNLRIDGRLRTDYRPFSLEAGIVSNTNGSARVRLGGTDVLVGVKVEIGEPDPFKPKEGRLEVSVDLSPSASPEFEGRGGDEIENEIGAVLQNALHDFDCQTLCIVEGEQCWVVYIDALVLVSAGNVFDVLSLAVRAALSNTKVPKVTVAENGEGRVELEISDDPHDVRPLSVGSVPVIVTLSQVGAHHIVDATIEEESCATASIHVAINPKGDICMVNKAGPGGIEPQSLFDALESAKQVGLKLLSQLDVMLRQEEHASTHFANGGDRGFLSNL